MFKPTPLALATLTLMTIGPIGAARAQTAPDQRIEITGSNLRRLATETASPVQTVTRDDIEKSGKGSIAELLQTLAVDNQGSVPMTFGNGFAAGASGISLRGLGAASTLVLINGRRIAPFGLADDGQKVFADLNTLPLEAVERVEILKDGASAIYGSDAIAGVVNVILRRNFVGTTFKATLGAAQEGDARNGRLALTHGRGEFERDGYNLLFNLEFASREAIWNRERAGRAQIGRADLRDLGFDANAGLAGAGAILDNNVAVSSIAGNVRNPATFDYWSRGEATGGDFTRRFAGAACANLTQHPQGDPGHNGARGCLIDAAQAYGQIQPAQDTLNLFVRGSVRLGSEWQAYAEANLYKSRSEASSTPSAVSSSVGFPGGPVSNAAVALGASHPDNPYFGSTARLRYLAADIGPRVNTTKSTFGRLLLGAKGSWAGWDVDTALLASQTEAGKTRTGYLQRDVTFALLNPSAANVSAARAGSAAYAALPAGTVWRIAENAGLNSAAMLAALSPTLFDDSLAKVTQVDLKLARDLMPLPGGPLGLALGVEARRESIRLDPTTGTERGNVIGLGYSAYEGARTLQAAYAELLAPVSKQLELSAALRADRYSDVGNSTTPKLGVKFTPSRQFALRGSLSEGFRAPSAAENGKGGLAAFSAAVDPLRCNLGVQSACSAFSVAVITSPNPDLVPETSKSQTLGLVFEPLPGTLLALDAWQIERRNEINQETTTAAIAAGKVARDPSTATNIPGDPGAITAVLARYINSARSTVRGVDLDLRQGLSLGGAGKLALDLKWTHLLTWRRVDADGTVYNFAGTHGNCDTTNCNGTPADRINLGLTWERGDWRVAALANHRAAISARTERDAADCSFHFADGRDAPAGCRIASFTSVDLTWRWKLKPGLELSGAVNNVFDRVAPLDPVTYGAVSYNPLDYAGAVGRSFSVGVTARF
jgi:iron complex outermembrane recepter protein